LGYGFLFEKWGDININYIKSFSCNRIEYSTISISIYFCKGNGRCNGSIKKRNGI
jgi:hypothetical protein